MVLRARGHANIGASHHKTLEITRDVDLTERGTCIVGVAATWDDAALLRLRGRVEVALRSGGAEARLTATVSPSFVGGTSLVLRRGEDLADRTFAHHASLSAADLDRDLVGALRGPGAELEVEITSLGGHPGPGALFVVGLPIGHHDDITPRARRVLAGVDLVLAEDTRRYRSTARDLGLPVPEVRSHHLGNEADGAGRAVDALVGGARVALVSDAGTPTISDPGLPLVRLAREAGVVVHPVPGPSAPVAALSAAGVAADTATFAGFLPRRGAARRAALAELGRLPGAVVVFEAPHRLHATLDDLAAVLPGRDLCIARELTKVHEEITSTRTDEAPALLADVAPRGEHTLVIGPGPPAPAGEGAGADAAWALARHLGDAVPTRLLADALAAATGLPRKEAYRRVLALRDEP